MQTNKTDIAQDGYLAVIPARGGSKRLPGKNTRLLGGAPLLAHSIKFALKAPQVDRVVVSTDSPDIAQVAATMVLKSSYAPMHWRPIPPKRDQRSVMSWKHFKQPSTFPAVSLRCSRQTRCDHHSSLKMPLQFTRRPLPTQ